MKILLSSLTLIATLSFEGKVKADVLPEVGIPALSSTHAECWAWAGDVHRRGVLCEERIKCMTDHSDNEGVLRECLGEANNRYQHSLATANPPAINPPEKSLPEKSAYFGEEAPIRTNSSFSDYQKRDGQRGWENATEGGSE